MAKTMSEMSKIGNLKEECGGKYFLYKIMSVIASYRYFALLEHQYCVYQYNGL